MVSIKEDMIGKTVECTKCKDKFLAEKPAEESEKNAAQSKKSSAKKNEAGKGAKAGVDVAEEDEPVQVKSGKGKTDTKTKGKTETNGKSNGKAPKDTEKDGTGVADAEDATNQTKQQAASKNKLKIGLALAGVGVVVLGLAGFFMMGRTPPAPKGNTPQPPPGPVGAGGDPEIKPVGKKDEKPPKEWAVVPLSEAEIIKLTNLLPNDTEHVFHAFFANLFDPNGPLPGAAFQPARALQDANLREKLGLLDDADLRKKMGFSLQSIDDLIHAERNSGSGWSYTVIHFKELIPQDELKTALKLKPVAPAIEDQTYFQTMATNPTFERLGRFSFGVPSYLQTLSGRAAGRTTYVHFHNGQTLIVGDEAPIKGLLKNKGQFPALSMRAAPAPAIIPDKDKEKPMPGIKPPGVIDDPIPEKSTNTNPDKSTNKNPDKANPDKANPDKANPDKGANPLPANVINLALDDSYATIKPNLKAILDRMEFKGPEGKDAVFFSSATDMVASRIDNLPPEYKDRIVRHPRQVWDVTLMLAREPKTRIRTLGTALAHHEQLRYVYRNEMSCLQEADAKELQKELMDQTSYDVGFFFDRLLNHAVAMPTNRPPPKEKGVPPPNTKPEEKKPSADQVMGSNIAVYQQASTVDFVLELSLDNPSMTKTVAIASLAASALRADIEAANASLRHMLAGAGRMLGEKGLTKFGVQPGRFPPGVFVRPNVPPGVLREPKNRISWMAGLLPYMGQQNLFSKIRFDQSWRDPGNWVAGQTIVPQFIDPTYPDFTRQAAVRDSPIDWGATHYVGMAGVGLDAASYKRGNPATRQFEGIFSYDGSATMEEVRKGRGQSNTIMMIQIPPTAYISPWLAGGGATVRGVPEKNSVAPFVFATDRNKRGTYAMMADGSVRYIDQTISDEVFKAMCTVHGPAPANMDLDNDPNTPLVPEDDNKEAKPVNKDAKKPDDKEAKKTDDKDIKKIDSKDTNKPVDKAPVKPAETKDTSKTPPAKDPMLKGLQGKTSLRGPAPVRRATDPVILAGRKLRWRNEAALDRWQTCG
jgi:hypothetical protein